MFYEKIYKIKYIEAKNYLCYNNYGNLFVFSAVLYYEKKIFFKIKGGEKAEKRG